MNKKELEIIKQIKKESYICRYKITLKDTEILELYYLFLKRLKNNNITNIFFMIRSVNRILK